MKPTTIKTHTTKSLSEYSGENLSGYIEVGGIEHRINFSVVDGHPRVWRPAGPGQQWKGISSHAVVTTTDTREMTTDDLQVGDCFRIEGQRPSLRFMVWLDDLRVIHVHEYDRDTERFHTCIAHVPEIDELSVTLVDVEFEAEPVDEERTIMLNAWTGPFELQGCKGERIGHNSCHGLVNVKWLDAGGGLREECQLLPGGLTVTVREPAAYDSPDDISVGDVVVGNCGTPGILFCVGDGIANIIWGDDMQYDNAWYEELTPARLTSVTWTPREEVTR